MNATAILQDEHQTILRVLACMEVLACDPAHADESVETMRAIVEFLRDYADRLHHGKEEALLFPAMEARGIHPEAGPTAAMRHEHELGRALVRRMNDACATSAPEFDRAAWSEAGLEFVALLRGHIAKEDHILFPLAERLLLGNEASQLSRTFAAVDERDFPASIHDDYETWAVDLAHRLAIFDERFEVRPGCAS